MPSFEIFSVSVLAGALKAEIPDEYPETGLQMKSACYAPRPVVNQKRTLRELFVAIAANSDDNQFCHSRYGYDTRIII